MSHPSPSLRRAALGAGLALTLAACGDDGGPEPRPPQVAQVEIVTGTSAVLFADTLQLDAVARDSTGRVIDSVALAWRSADPDVATVTATGGVVGRATGHARIIASAGAHADTATIQVPPRWIAVDAGWGFACALDDEGAAWCWGANGIGQLGNGTGSSTSISTVPARVVTDQRFVSIHTGQHTACAITADGTAWCWGDIEGSETTATRLPVRLPGDARWRAFGLGRFSFCGATTEGELRCWGYRYGSTPVPLGPARGYTQVVMGERDGCALGSSGEAWCWGYNGQGQYGMGGFESSEVPVRAFTAHAVAQVGAGTAHNCVRTTAGDVYCAGVHGGYGSLGDGSSTEYSATPLRASLGGMAASQLESDNRGNCVVVQDGTVRCWGAFVRVAAAPWVLENVTRATHLAMGNGSGYALTMNGRLWAWGDNSTGQLGDGTSTRRDTPVLVRDRWGL